MKEELIMRKLVSIILVAAMLTSPLAGIDTYAAGINRDEDIDIVQASDTDAAESDEQESTVPRRQAPASSGIDGTEDASDDYQYLEDMDEISISDKQLVEGPIYDYGDESRNTVDRIHYINLNDGNPDHTSDAILIESNGHYGLVDASNRDGDSRFGIASNSSASGAAVLKYIASLGVDHLDFILVTHSHSDHLGGVPDIVKDVASIDITDTTSSIYDVETQYYEGDSTAKEITDSSVIDIISDEEDNEKPESEKSESSKGHLVDESTTYIYKAYTANPTEDSWGWANGTYFSEAMAAMSKATKLEVSSHSGLGRLGAVFAANGSGNYDDSISFRFGDFNISLYNLYSRSNNDENANSIITYIEKSGTKTVLMADLDLYDDLENKIASAVVAQHGKVNVIKVGHHGNTQTGTPASTSKKLLDTLGATTAIICTSNTLVAGYTPFYGYMRQKNMNIYRTMDASGSSIVQDMTSGLSIRTGSITSTNDQLVYSVTNKYALRTVTTKYYGIPATDEQDPEIRANKVTTESQTITEVRTVTQDTVLRLGGEPAQWSQHGQNDWAKWYKSATAYDWVFVNGDGSLKKGWQTILQKSTGRNFTYYFDSEGIMQTGWTKKSGKNAYLFLSDYGTSPQGALATGWALINGKWYCFDADGRGHDGWMQSGVDWYWIEDSVTYTGGLKNIKGVNYFFGADGKMKTGWQKYNGSSYYFDSNGKAHSGWIKSGDNWYYTEPDGKMVTSQWVDNYWIGANGVWSYKYQGSWKVNAKGWWYEDSSGWYPSSTWQKINGKWYYFGSDGYMAANEWVDGQWADSNGYFTYKYRGSWKSNSKGWWFEDASGWYPANKWQKINGKWYYFEGNGYMAASKYIGSYWVNSSGACE